MKGAAKLGKTTRLGQDSDLNLHLFGKQSLTRNTITAVATFLASFSFAFLCGSLAFIENDTNAAEEGYGDGTGGTIAFSVDKPSLQLDISNANLGQLVTGEINTSVTTDNLTGYTLSILTANPDNTALVHTNGTDSIPSTTNTTAATLAMNTWGYNLAPALDPTPTQVTTFKQIPATAEVITSTTTPTDPVDGEQTKLVFGLKADMGKPAGLYSTEFIYSAVANFVPVTITSITPNTSVWEGDEITITGQFLNDTADILIGTLSAGIFDEATATSCTSFTQVSATQVRCVLPSKTAGTTYNVLVKTTFGESNVDKTITYATPPTITAVNPYINWTGGDIYITGTKLDTVTDVTIAGSSCQSLKSISATKLRCTLPSKNSGDNYSVMAISSKGNSNSDVTVNYDGQNKGNMQAFRWAQCESMERGQAQVWTDSRNSQTYRVKKMQDGKCWMVDNLRYAGADWQFGGNNTANIFQYADSGTASQADCYEGADLSACFGYQYNWYTATYGTGASSVESGDVTGNICPNTSSKGSASKTPGGWRLPSSGNGQNSDYYLINAAMFNDDGSSNSQLEGASSSANSTYSLEWRPSGPFQGALAGFMLNDTPTYKGTGAWVWSSTAVSANYAYNLFFNNSSHYVGDPMGDNSDLFSVRCLVSEPTGPVADDKNWTGGDIYVDGTGFTTSTTASVGGTACQSTKYISATKVRCTLPSKATGTTHAVTTSNGTPIAQNVEYDGTSRGTMQEFRTEQCSVMKRGQAQVWTDSRDSQTYRIKKMPDGKCWMIDNLRYAYGTLTSSGYLTVDGTSTQSEANNASPRYVNPGTATAAGCSAGANLSTCYGYFYNWYTTTYGTGTYNQSTQGNQVAGNICPNSTAQGSTTATTGGWRLPSSRSGTSGPSSNGTSYTVADYPHLNIAMSSDDGTTTNYTGAITDNDNTRPHWQPTGSFQGTFSGGYDSGLLAQGSYGYYWSSTAYSASGAYNLYYFSGHVNPAYNANVKRFGYAVRCLVDS